MNIKTVRIHVGGDFYSSLYIQSWIDIAEAFPNTSFYGYSKAFNKFILMEKLNSLPNVNIIDSVLPDGHLNFGPIGYVARKASEFNISICPVTAGHKHIKCGLNCSKCLTEQYMLFVKH